MYVRNYYFNLFCLSQGFKKIEWRIWNGLGTYNERRDGIDSAVMLKSGMCISGVFCLLAH